ncbi:MAG TPA: restriction endonuclease subunit S [Fodinibius sp.]|nr:restriction endonuclease subunit S [Fodinibius sp.]
MKLKELANISTGYSFRSKVRHDPEGQTKVIQMGDVDKYKGIMVDSLSTIANFSPRSDRYFLNEGDIIMISKGYNLNAYLIPEGVGKVVAVNSFIVLKVTSAKIIPAYLVWFLNAVRTQHFLKAVASGTSTPSLSKRTLETVEITFPSKERQQLLCDIDQLKRKEINLHKQVAQKKKKLIDVMLQQQADKWKPNNTN